MMFPISPSLPVRETDDIVLETIPVKIANGAVVNKIIDFIQTARGDYERMDEYAKIAYDDPFKYEEDWEKFGGEIDEELAAVLSISHLEHLLQILAFFCDPAGILEWHAASRRCN